MAAIGAKLGQNTFQRIPDISFFDAEKKLQTLNGRLPPEDGSVRRETLGKRVSDHSQHFIFRHPQKIVGENVWSKFLCFAILLRFLRSYEFLDVTGRFSLKNDPPCNKFQLSTTRGGGVKGKKTF